MNYNSFHGHLDIFLTFEISVGYIDKFQTMKRNHIACPVWDVLKRNHVYKSQIKYSFILIEHSTTTIIIMQI